MLSRFARNVQEFCKPLFQKENTAPPAAEQSTLPYGMRPFRCFWQPVVLGMGQPRPTAFCFLPYGECTVTPRQHIPVWPAADAAAKHVWPFYSPWCFLLLIIQDGARAIA